MSVALALERAVHALGGTAEAKRAVAVLLVVEVAQGAIGFVQYFTNLPVLLVGAHMLGSCLVWVATLSVITPGRTPPARAGRVNPVGTSSSSKPV